MLRVRIRRTAKFGVRVGIQGVVGGVDRIGFHVGTGMNWEWGHSDLGLEELGEGYG